MRTRTRTQSMATTTTSMAKPARTSMIMAHMNMSTARHALTNTDTKDTTMGTAATITNSILPRDPSHCCLVAKRGLPKRWELHVFRQALFVRLRIFFQVAEHIARQGSRRNFKVSVQDMGTYDRTNLPEESIVIFVACTTGEGVFKIEQLPISILIRNATSYKAMSQTI